MITSTLLVGCGKKDEAANKPAESAKPADTTKPGDPAKPPEAAKPPPAPGTPEPLQPAPAGVPKECQDAEAAMRKIMACDKIDVQSRVDMAKAWNAMVEGSLKPFAKAGADNQATITRSCASMVETSKMLTAECP